MSFILTFEKIFLSSKCSYLPSLLTGHSFSENYPHSTFMLVKNYKFFLKKKTIDISC